MSNQTSGRRRCSRCDAEFVCGAEAGAPRCWCAVLPQNLPVPKEPAGCYCPDCLAALIEQGERLPSA